MNHQDSNRPGQGGNSPRHDDLERFVSDVARGQPPRRAPASLEMRVMAEIAGRHPVAAAGWRRGFAHWPLAARVAFVIVSCGFVKLALSVFSSLITQFDAQDVVGAGMFHRSAEAVSTTVSVGEIVLHAIPPMWLYGAATFCFVLYALLFGLGTVAYRTLYVQR